jgi:hypothetical protein
MRDARQILDPPRHVLQDHLRPREFGRLLYGHYRLQERTGFLVCPQRPLSAPRGQVQRPPGALLVFAQPVPS